MNEFTVRLDLAKGKARQQQTVFVRQGDKNATTIVATITDHGAAAATSGLTARFQMRLPDGTHYYRKAASLSGNVATVALDEAQAASVAGRTDVAYFQLLQGSTVVASTESFTVVVLPDALGDATVPESYDSAIQDAIDNLDAAVENLPSTVEDVLTAHPEWTTTVQDGSITKDKLATDLALDRERLLYRLDNLLTNALPEGDVATATDAAKTPVAGLALYGRSTQDGTPTPSAPVAIVSVGTANLIKRPYKSGTQVTTNGITWTVNDDGSITANGTATANSNFILNDRDMFGSHPQGTYTLSGSPAVAGCYVCLQRATAAGGMASVMSTAGSQTTFTTDTELAVATGNNSLFCRVPNGTTVSNAVFRPMLNAGSTAYPYVPYGHAGLWARRTSDASASTVTPIPLDGHELRSLPDGTRDEVTVDSRGHAVLVQRVGSYTVTGSEQYVGAASVGTCYRVALVALSAAPAVAGQRVYGYCTHAPYNSVSWTEDRVHTYADGNNVALFAVGSSVSDVLNAYKGAEITYHLATPVTHDLGYVAAVPLVGPDLTAQAVPTAPLALTYERDLNTTLAKLESAIATLA